VQVKAFPMARMTVNSLALQMVHWLDVQTVTMTVPRSVLQKEKSTG
jgi:hypothetical protein